MQIANCSTGGRLICSFQFSFSTFNLFTDCTFPARPAAASSNAGESTAIDQDNAERNLDDSCVLLCQAPDILFLVSGTFNRQRRIDFQQEAAPLLVPRREDRQH